MKNVFVISYSTGKHTRYSMFQSKKEAKVWGFRRMAKTGEYFTIMSMIEAEAMKLR